jgi:hypothetical protein
VTVRRRPIPTHERLVADLGVYVQDTWTIKRMTVNAGLRMGLPEQQGRRTGCARRDLDSARGHFYRARRRAELSTTVSRASAVAYDLRRHGKTALRRPASRYVQTSDRSGSRG